jgi:hypothetical protein
MTNYETQSSRERGFIYWVALGLLVVFALIALFTFSSARQTRQASEKADEYIAALQDAGLTAPSKDQITRLLGDDGGALCDDPGDALRRAIVNAQLTNGASGPGMRPILADVQRLLKGQLTAIEVYCPDELDDFRNYVEDLESESVTEG